MGKLLGVIISLLLNTAHLRVHGMDGTGSKWFSELLLEVAKLARYSADFGYQNRVNKFLHSEAGTISLLPLERENKKYK